MLWTDLLTPLASQLDGTAALRAAGGRDRQ